MVGDGIGAEASQNGCGACFIQKLSDDILLKCFAQLPTTERLVSCPLVCKRWAVLLDQPSPAWSQVSLAFGAEHGRPLPDGIKRRFFWRWRDVSTRIRVLHAASRWFEQRAGSITDLSVLHYDIPSGIPEHGARHNAASLRRLWVNCGLSPDVLPLVAACRGLRSLRLQFTNTQRWTEAAAEAEDAGGGNGAGAGPLQQQGQGQQQQQGGVAGGGHGGGHGGRLDVLSSLTLLTELDIGGVGLSCPRDLDLRRFTPRLIRLTLGLAAAGSGAVPDTFEQLDRLALQEEYTSSALPVAVATCPGLTRLEVSRWTPPEAQGMQAAGGVNQWPHPAMLQQELAQLKGLRVLHLSAPREDDRVHLQLAGLDRLACLTGLTSLTLSKCGLTCLPDELAPRPWPLAEPVASSCGECSSVRRRRRRPTLPVLAKLDLSGNWITRLPSWMWEALPNLETLLLIYQFGGRAELEVPLSIRHMPRLREVAFTPRAWPIEGQFFGDSFVAHTFRIMGGLEDNDEDGGEDDSAADQGAGHGAANAGNAAGGGPGGGGGGDGDAGGQQQQQLLDMLLMAKRSRLDNPSPAGDDEHADEQDLQAGNGNAQQGHNALGNGDEDDEERGHGGEPEVTSALQEEAALVALRLGGCGTLTQGRWVYVRGQGVADMSAQQGVPVLRAALEAAAFMRRVANYDL